VEDPSNDISDQDIHQPDIQLQDSVIKGTLKTEDSSQTAFVKSQQSITFLMVTITSIISSYDVLCRNSPGLQQLGLCNL